MVEVPPITESPAEAGLHAADRERPADKPAEYVGVVYFHGMGSQRHYEDVSEIVDRLDRTAYELSHTEYPGLRLARRVARVERARDEGADRLGGDVVYILARAIDRRKIPASEKRPDTVVRFYEAYWAPETVAGTRAPSVAWWLLRQTRKPLQLLLAPWRSYRRLRRGALVAIFVRRRDAGHPDVPALRKRVARLVDLYETFQEPGERSRFPLGSFKEFEAFLREETRNADRAEAAALLELARDWRSDHDRREWLHLVAIATLLAGAFGFLGVTVLLVSRVLTALTVHVPAGWPGWAASLVQGLPPTTQLVATVVPSLLSAIGITKFLEDYVGDVQQYVTYEETDRLYQRRKAVLESGMRQLRHVLLDPLCKRVVVVAHSLGTAVAVDSLLGLWRFNRAAAASRATNDEVDLGKISHLLTYGSPVDKINYFFAVSRSDSATYEDLVESLRGDIGTPPFSRTGRQPRIHWINFWDKGDVISGPIETLAADHLREQEIDNVRVASHVLPDLGASHGAYLHHPRVIDDLLRIAIFDDFDYEHVPRDGDGRPLYLQVRRGPGAGKGAQTAAFALVYVLPWAMFGTFLEMLLHRNWGIHVVLAFAVAVQVLGIVVHWFGARRARRSARRPVTHEPD